MVQGWLKPNEAHPLVRYPPMSISHQFTCVCCGDDAPEDQAVHDKALVGPICQLCNYRCCMAAKWLARGYKWLPEHGDEAKQYEGPCATRPLTNNDINQSNYHRFN